ncbi:MAG: hypothetical protein AB1445_12375 [Bacillota bacterium]
MLYGNPAYYSRFGFVPVMPRCTVELSVAGRTGSQELTRASVAHANILCALYDRFLATYPCAVARTVDAWQWHLRLPERESILLLPDLSGYALVRSDPGGVRLVVHEAAAGKDCARQLLYGLAREAEKMGLDGLKLYLPPNHPVARVARLQGAQEVLRPAGAGMVVVCRWDPLLPEGYSVGQGMLYYQHRPVALAGEKALARLVTGYWDFEDLALSGEGQALPSAPPGQRLPTGFPRWWLEPFWF